MGRNEGISWWGYQCLLCKRTGRGTVARLDGWGKRWMMLGLGLAAAIILGEDVSERVEAGIAGLLIVPIWAFLVAAFTASHRVYREQREELEDLRPDAIAWLDSHSLRMRYRWKMSNALLAWESGLTYGSTANGLYLRLRDAEDEMVLRRTERGVPVGEPPTRETYEAAQSAIDERLRRMVQEGILDWATDMRQTGIIAQPVRVFYLSETGRKALRAIRVRRASHRQAIREPAPRG